MMILPVATLMALAAASRVAGRSWLSPGAFFSAFWAGIVLAGAIGAPDFETPWIGPAWIALACLALAMGALMGELAQGRGVSGVAPGPDRVYDGLPIAIGACVAMGMAYLVARIVILGPVWSFDEEDDDLPKAFQLLLATHYAGPAFGGLYFASGRRRSRWIGLASLLAPGLTALVYLRRSWLLMSGMFFVGGLFTAWVRSHQGPPRLVTPRRLALGAAITAGLAGVAVLFQVFRLGLDGTEASLSDTATTYREALGSGHLEEAWNRVRVILFGYVTPFSHWMDQAWDRPPAPTWGVWTFSGPFRIFGVGRLSRLDDFQFQTGALSNLYTAFYGLIVDFSPAGALAAMFGFGLASGWAYRGVAEGRVAAMPALIGFYAATIFSPLWSLFRYNALIGGLAYVGLYLALVALARRDVGAVPSPSATHPFPLVEVN